MLAAENVEVLATTGGLYDAPLITQHIFLPTKSFILTDSAMAADEKQVISIEPTAKDIFIFFLESL